VTGQARTARFGHECVQPRFDSFPCAAALRCSRSCGCGDDEPNRVRVSFGLEQPSAPVAALTAVVHFPSSVIVSQSAVCGCVPAAGGIDQADVHGPRRRNVVVDIVDAEGFSMRQRSRRRVRG
jgi:hypothetical protein